MTNPLRARSGAVLAACLLALPLLGCSSPEEPADRSGSGTPAPSVHEGQQLRPLGQVVLGQVAGRLPRQDRRRVLTGVSRVVDGWLADAYLTTDGRRIRADRAFGAFTPGVRPQARRDRALLSNLGSRAREVRPQRRRIAVDVVAAGRRAVGATARVRLVFTVDGQKRPTLVRGRVFLTRTPGGWRIFGYDVSRGAA